MRRLIVSRSTCHSGFFSCFLNCFFLLCLWLCFFFQRLKLCTGSGRAPTSRESAVLPIAETELEVAAAEAEARPPSQLHTQDAPGRGERTRNQRGEREQRRMRKAGNPPSSLEPRSRAIGGKGKTGL